MAQLLISTSDRVATSRNAARPVRAATRGAHHDHRRLRAVFLVGGLAGQIGEELGFSPTGLGPAVSAYVGATALAPPAGALVERYG